ncbi:MAG TPA: hypothetical protein PK760_11730, partial [Flavobacteriales bacterium]|nr:hypothetical protein [Flavobacteriales bacterium]
MRSACAFAQQNNIPLQRDIYIDVERNAVRDTTPVHDGLKPLIQSRADTTNVMGYRVDKGRYYYWLTEKIFKEHLLMVNDKDFRLNVDPVFNLEIGQDRGDRTAYADTNRYIVNSRGVMIAGDIGKKLSFQTVFYETQALVPKYLLSYSYETGVIAGQARTKYKSNNVTLDYAWSQGNVSYSPTTWLNIQFGHGKHFVGHGYRSMLLSDNAIVS